MKYITKIENECPFCKTITTINVRPSRLTDLYFRGFLLAQEAFDYLSDTEREVIISGICPKCQDDIFGDF